MQKIVFAAIIIAVFSMVVLFGNMGFVGAHSAQNHSMTVQVDLIGFGGGSGDGISIEVPDLIDLGELSKTKLTSSEEGIWINNTGTVDIRVTPQLADPEEEIFKYLYFRKQTSTSTNNTGLIVFKKIGNYYIDINKPSTGKTYRTEHCYAQLNLSEFTGRITNDINNYRADIIFLATAK